MRKLSIRHLVLAGLLAALVLICTMLVEIPAPTRGYIHLGDTLVYLCGILLGPLTGGISAAIGSTLADLFSGYAVYAPVTFVIKFLDAAIVGAIYLALSKKSDTLLVNIGAFTIAVLAGSIVMVGGYLLFETVLYGLAVAILNVPFNITQAVGGAVLATPILAALQKLGFTKDGLQ